MHTQPRTDIYTRITNHIIEAIEAGAGTFKMPWHSQAFAGMPRNPVTKRPYRGINVLTLWVRRMEEGYASSHWASYLQWKSIGAQVKEGMKGTPVLFYKREDEQLTDSEETRTRMLLKHSYVFNGDQVSGWGYEESVKHPSDETLEHVDRFIDAIGSDTRYGSDTAYYAPAQDRIFMPRRSEFYNTWESSALEGFYAVLLHEHVHWSGHKTRLNRDLTGRFGSESYAMEELIAELGAAFLCATLGISTFPRPDHASYIHSWVKVLKEQKTAIVSAASMASSAAQFLEDLAARSMQPEEFIIFSPAR